MGSRLRDFFFGHWRNKGVALFFAVTIWTVAYQSEFKQSTVAVRIQLVPRQEDRLLVRQDALRKDKRVPFGGNVALHVNGSRKQIDDVMSTRPEGVITVVVDAEDDSNRGKHVFSKEDLTFMSFSLITIERFDPESVELVFDDKVEKEFEIKAEFGKPPGWDTEALRVTPADVTLSGPKSFLNDIEVVAKADLQDPAVPFHGVVPLKLKVLSEANQDLPAENLIEFVGPSEVELDVTLKHRLHEHDEEAVRIWFLVPDKFPYKIEFEERTIPVVFRGPEREIARLKEKVKDPDFFLGVRVPEAALSSEKEVDFTFTEDELLLLGFSEEVRMFQHRKRKEKGLVAWTYTVTPIPPTTGTDS